MSSSPISTNPLGSLGVLANNPPNIIPNNRAPRTTDINANLGDIWMYYTVNPAQFFILGNLFGGVATWLDLGTAIAAIQSISGNTGKAVADASGNVNVTGIGPLSFSASGSTNQGSIANATNSSLGIASFSNQFTVFAGAVSLNNVSVPEGGTGQDSFPSGNLIVGNGTSPLSSTNTPSVSSITILNSPISATDGANKAYVDEIGSGFSFVDAVLVACTVNLDATYDNGSSGVGATLTNAGTQEALVIDGVTLSIGNRVLVQFQNTQYENGVYSVTDIGSPSTNWVMTRTTDYDTVPPISQGNLVPVQSGDTWAATLWLETYDVVTIGTDPIIFQTYTPSSFQINVQTFTSSGTYIPTSGLLYSIVEGVGGGGGTGGIPGTGANSQSVSAGAGAGGYFRKLLNTSEIGASQDITIGAGGLAGTSGQSTGGNGGATFFGSICSGTGGTGTTGSSVSTQALSQSGNGGVGIGGDVNSYGSPGQSGFAFESIGIFVLVNPGSGGSSYFGGGAKAGISNGNQVLASPGNNYGGGASGAGNGSSSAAQAGAAGAPGYLIVTEYIQ